jgi:hypothetical protein
MEWFNFKNEGKLMGTVNVVQLQEISNDSHGELAQIAHMPAISSENVTSSGTSAQSAAFGNNCRFVRIATDTTVRILFAANPTALQTSIRLLADTAEYFGVVAGQKVAVIDES